MHSSIKDPMFTQTVEHDWRSQLLIKCKFIIFLLSIITFPLSSKFREIMLFFLCSLYIKYVVSLNISIVSITTLNQYLAVNSQQFHKYREKALNCHPFSIELTGNVRSIVLRIRMMLQLQMVWQMCDILFWIQFNCF